MHPYKYASAAPIKRRRQKQNCCPSNVSESELATFFHAADGSRKLQYGRRNAKPMACGASWRGLCNFVGMGPAGEFTLRIEQVDGFDFRVDFDKEEYASLRMDEPAPLGNDAAPNPVRILAAAIGDCLSASLVFCLKRRGIIVQGLRSEVRVQLVRNEHKRLRVGRIEVAIHPRDAIPDEALDA